MLHWSIRKLKNGDNFKTRPPLELAAERLNNRFLVDPGRQECILRVVLAEAAASKSLLMAASRMASSVEVVVVFEAWWELSLVFRRSFVVYCMK